MKHQYSKAAWLLLFFTLLTSVTYAQITGIVTDEDGLGLPGVNILVVGTTSGTVTDVDGSYSINAAADATLRFSYLGFATQEVAVNGRNVVNISLANDANVIEEVVVIGYGQTKKEAVTGAVSSVASEEITSVTVTNVGEAIQGRLAGVTVTNQGAPGVAPIIQVRGIGSINFGSGPLFVIDGVPTNGLNSFDTRDIESATVLKDASATAIYGSRASNGVILIETKKGRNIGGLDVRLESTIGIQNQPRRYDLLNASQYLQYAEILNGAPLARDLDEPVNSQTSQTYRQTDTDWQDAIFQDGLLTHNTLSISGGTDVSRVYASGSFYRQEGVMIGTPYERFNFRINSDHSIGGKFKVGQTLMVVNDKREKESNLGGRTQFLQAVQSIPYQPVFNPDNIGGFSGAVQALDSADPGNPVLAANLLQDIDRVTRLFGTLYAELEIVDGLKARALFGANFSNFRRDARRPIYESTVDTEFNIITNDRSTDYSPLYSGQLSYNKIFGDHSIDAVLVGEVQETYSNQTNAQVDQTSNSINVLQGGINPILSGREITSVLQSIVGRATYGYKGKYLATFSFRRDGSSIFAPGNQFETFPAAALAWRISEEPFMAGTGVSELKLRGSYGRTGSVGLGPYSFQAPINQSFGATLGEGNQPIGAFINSLANDGLRWEITDMLNVGVDVGFLNNRLNFSMEYYDREVDNLILNVQLPPSVGVGSTIQNTGAMRNTGLEFQAEYFSNRSNDFRWNVRANLSTNTNEVLRLATEDEILLQGNFSAYTGDFNSTITRVGDPIASFFGFQTMGLFQSQAEIDEAPTQENAAPGDVRFVDQNNDGVINADDRVILGNYLPDFTYGITFNATFRNLDLNLFIQGSQGNDIYNGMQSLLTKNDRLFNGGVELLEAWTPQNTSATQPRTALGDPNNNRRMSDRFLEDGSYARLKNITLGYTFPLPQSGTLSSARVYFSAQNLITITGYSGIDPEIGSAANLVTGFDLGVYPQPRTFLFGVQVGF